MSTRAAPSDAGNKNQTKRRRRFKRVGSGVYIPTLDADAAAAAAAALTPDILSITFLYVDVPDVPAISQTSKQWKRTLGLVEEELWTTLAKKHHPTLERLMKLLPDPSDPPPAAVVNDGEGSELLPPSPQSPVTSRSWKQMFRRISTSSYEPVEFNKKLQKDFEIMFREEGIVAFSNCCHYHCSGAYNEVQNRDSASACRPAFEPREKGVYFIRLHLNGMNYDLVQRKVYAIYEDFDYLTQHWEGEHAMLVRWCAVLGLKVGEFTIEKPASEDLAVCINFLKPLNLEEPTWSDDDEEEEVDEAQNEEEKVQENEGDDDEED